MKSNTKTDNKSKATGLGKTNGKKQEVGSRKKARVSATAVKTHPVKKIPGVENMKPRARNKISAEPYNERVIISGKALSRWKVMPSASKEHIIKVLDNVIGSVINNTKQVSQKDVQIQLNQLKHRISTSLTSLKVPPMKDYKKLELQCKVLEETLVETNKQSERLDEEIEQIEKLIEEKQEDLDGLENANSGTQNDDRSLNPALEEGSYVNQLGLPPLLNPAGYSTGIIKQGDDDLHFQYRVVAIFK